MPSSLFRQKLQTLTHRKKGVVELIHQHRGVRHILVADGTGAWRYYIVTPRQLSFWRRLSRAERNYLVRMSRRSCFVCLLRDAMKGQERMEVALYRAMMSFLLWPHGRASQPDSSDSATE
jgi:hypothetical protein